jgi:DNA polymerase-3 subunit delta
MVDLARTMPFLSDHRMIVAHIDSLVSKSGSESKERKEERETAVDNLVSYAEDPSPNVVIVLVAEDVDRRLRTFKQLVDHSADIDCKPLKGRAVPRWINERLRKSGYQPTRRAAQLLADSLENDLTLMANELEKIMTYVGDKKEIDVETIKKLAFSSLQTDIFGLVDALAVGDGETACTYIRRFLMLNESFTRLIHMIARQFRLIWQIKLLLDRGLDRQAVRQRLQLHPFVVKKTSGQARNFSYDQLEKALELILETDVGLKSGRWEEQVGLERLAVRLTEQAQNP